MDRVVLEQHLALAERHVSEGTDHIARQREIVGALIDNGHDSRAAQALLVQFEQMLALHFADRDRLRAEVTALDRDHGLPDSPS